jgi:NitT/TauT family transport system permease protein
VTLVRNLIGLVGFFLLWEGVVRFGLVDRASLPTATDVAGILVDLLGQEPFLRDVVATVLAWLIALAIAVAIAVPAGLLR